MDAQQGQGTTYSVEYGDETGAQVQHTGTHAEMAALFAEMLAVLAPGQAPFTTMDAETGMPVGSDDVADAPTAEGMPYIGHATELDEERAVSRHGYDAQRGNWSLMFGATVHHDTVREEYRNGVTVESDGTHRVTVTVAAGTALENSERVEIPTAASIIAIIIGGTTVERVTDELLELADRARLALRTR